MSTCSLTIFLIIRNRNFFCFLGQKQQGMHYGIFVEHPYYRFRHDKINFLFSNKNWSKDTKGKGWPSELKGII